MADPTAGKDPPPPPSSSAEQMPPPPKPRPSIVTQAPSTSNIQQSIQDPGAGGEESIRPTNFNPFFILIDDATSKTTAHPRKMHYIFSDDDASLLLTDALVKSSQSHEAAGEDGDGQEGAEERVIILDLNATGDQVEKVQSLSPNWQVLSANIEKAPTLQEGDNGQEGTGGLMVRVEGVGVDGFEDGEIEGEGGEEMLGRFDAGLGILGRVVGLCDVQEERERERVKEGERRELEGEQSALGGESAQAHTGGGLEVSRGDLSKGHLLKDDVEGKGKGKERERKESLPEEDIGEG